MQIVFVGLPMCCIIAMLARKNGGWEQAVALITITVRIRIEYLAPVRSAVNKLCYRPYYIKWLKYCPEHCHRSRFDYLNPGSLPKVLNKPKEKNRREFNNNNRVN